MSIEVRNISKSFGSFQALKGVSLNKVKRLYIGVGNKTNPVPDGTGRIYIDDIRVTRP